MKKHIGTALKQVAFAWKFDNYALEGKMNLEDLDRSITFQEDLLILVLLEKIFESQEDMVVALETNLVIAFGVAAIILNRCREITGAKRFEYQDIGGSYVLFWLKLYGDQHMWALPPRLAQLKSLTS